jgi:hypothetical protein
MDYTQEQAERDAAKFEQMASEAEVKAGLYRVEASNCQDRVGHKKVHMPNLGPNSASNPPICQDCKKPQDQWIDGEECIPIE